jgi:hypothetical protein
MLGFAVKKRDNKTIIEMSLTFKEDVYLELILILVNLVIYY